MIVVQHIETRWTKRSRGMPGAAARNAVPRVMPLPAFREEALGICVHKVVADEEHGYDLHQRMELIEPGPGFMRHWSLRFVIAETAVLVEFRYSTGEHGLPRRREGRHPLFRLAPGDVGTLHINGRFSYTSGQFYKQHFVNVASVESATHDLFMRATANHFVDMTADLF
jgi:hypothetical protein